MLFRSLGVVAAALLALAAPAALGQSPTDPLYKFELTVQNEGRVEIGDSRVGHLRGNLTDRSEVTSVLPALGVQNHQVHYRLEPLVPVRGWVIIPPTDNVVQPGQTIPFEIQINVRPNAESPFNVMRLTAEVTDEHGMVHTTNATVIATYPGIASWSATAAVNVKLAPRESATVAFDVTSRFLEPHAFQVRVLENPCNFRVVPPPQVMVDRMSREQVHVGLVAPDDKLWYVFGDFCTIDLVVSNAEAPDDVRRVQLAATVIGFSGEFPFFFNTALAILVIVLLILLVRRVREWRDETLLGKPQKPWLIPVEKVYLQHLKRKDPKAHYVVRHYLMEDEYRSSLLWYKSYKAATKGDRKKERLILRHERKYARWKAKWARRIAKPMAQADAFDAKLQRRLDRKARKRFRKARRRWRKEVRRLKRAHAKAVERAQERHEKAVKKAAKKGRVVDTPLPHIAAPALPAEPQPKPLTLADHRWSRRAARHRKRMQKRQATLEVRFERADARYQDRLRRRVQRLARKLDDPAFVSEHPMLQDTKPAGR
jgi:hypothetical protein